MAIICILQTAPAAILLHIQQSLRAQPVRMQVTAAVTAISFGTACQRSQLACVLCSAYLAANLQSFVSCWHDR